MLPLTTMSFLELTQECLDAAEGNLPPNPENFPKSSIPLTTKIALICGTILLLAGVSFEVWR